MMNLELIKGFNPWWSNPIFRFSEEGFIKRLILKEIDKYIKIPQILSILGLRRTGKTTILKHFINKLLDEKKPESNIIFFSFEDYIGKKEPEALEKLLTIYLQKYLQKDIWEVQEKIYIFLDEIQYINHWQDILKRFYDKNKNLKFIISGSFSAVIRKKSVESLAGRIFEVIVPLFSFYEYCLLKKHHFNFEPIKIKDLADVTIKELNNIAEVQELNGSQISDIYEEYLYKGQFPEAVGFTDDSLVSGYIRGSVLNKILTEDAPKIFKIDKVGEFSSLYKIISKDTGNLFELLNMAREIGINKATLHNYIYYLEHLFLIKLVYNYTKKIRKQYRIQKKIYVASPNFTCNELSIGSNSPSFSLILGNLAETAVFQLLNYHYNEIFFWKHREKEIDFIVEGKNKIMAIEVKYVNTILPKHLNNMFNFMKQNKLKQGIIITKNKAGLSDTKEHSIVYVPIWSLV